MKVLHVPCHLKKDVLPVLEKNFGKLGSHERVGLVSTAQHLNQLDKIKELLESKGKKVMVGGQLLGCDQKPALEIEDKVDVFLYIGSGKFHPLGVALKTEKPVLVLNPYSEVVDEITDEEKQKWQKKQKARVTRALAADSYGILVSTKTGQYDIGKALEVKEKLIKKDKKVFLFAGDELTPGNLLPFNVGCYVNTACPRIVDDEYEKPVVNPEELYLIL